jgi:DNA processing protein
VANAWEQQLSFMEMQRPRPMTDDQRLHLLALAQVRGLGEVSLKKLLRAYPDLSAVWDAAPDELCRLLTSTGIRNPNNVVDQIVKQARPLQEAARRELERFDRQGIHLITDLDASYPQRLRTTKDAPPWLFVQGNVTTLSLPNLIAVVGTRDASPQGVALARSTSTWLADNGFGIVSGLAAGIDQAAHQAAIDYAVPTIAVLGTGILLAFPAATDVLRTRIVADGGAIATEYLPRESYSRTHFVRRNRIIAGLSYATVPVEGQERSGTAHTYRYARDFGRVVFGVKRTSVPMQNGILTLLREDSYPIFDLDSPDDLRELHELLLPALQEAPAFKRERRFFRPLLREFERVIRTYPVAQDDVDQFLAELEHRWRQISDDSQSDHP